MARDLPDLLFQKYDLRAVLEKQRLAVVKAVEEYPADGLTQEPEEQLICRFVEEFRVDPPVLTEGAISVSAEEAQVDVSGNPNRMIFDRSHPFYVPGVRVTYHVPFKGDPDLFKCHPSTYTLNPPRADLVGNELQFRYERTDNDIAATKREFDNELGVVRQYLGWLASDLSVFNASVSPNAKSSVEARRARLEKTQAGLQSLGLPLRREPQALAGASPRPAPAASTGRATRAAAARSTYDVALSFAGEDRVYVEQVAEGLRQAGVSVFYDKFEKAELWGKNLIDHLADIYQHRSQFVVMFVSKAYVDKAFPRLERQHAQARALVAKEEYILPARFDDTEVPGLPPTIGYTDLRNTSADELVGLILRKLGR